MSIELTIKPVNTIQDEPGDNNALALPQAHTCPVTGTSTCPAGGDPSCTAC